MTGDIINNVAIYEYPAIDVNELVNNRFTNKQILTFIDQFRPLKSKYERKLDFFIGKNKDIRHKVDLESPDNLINIPYDRKIVNTIKGYMFKPGFIQYTLKNKEIEEDEYYNLLMEIFKKNNEDIKTAETGEDQSKYGIGFEIVYNKMDKEGKIYPSFIKLKPCEVILIFDKTIERNLLSAIRCYKYAYNEKLQKDLYKIEVYYNDRIYYYDLIDELVKTNESINLYHEIPIAIYYNNDDLLADYEPIETLICLYDKLFSDSANELDRFAAAYLIFKNYVLGGNNEEINNKLKELKSKRIFEVDANGDVRFLTKDIPIEFFKEIKTTLQKEIIKQSQIPNFDEESFGTQSGIAIKYKLIDLENLCTFKESYFKTGLLKRIELINKFIELQYPGIEIKPIEIIFNRNLPMNYLESADLANKIKDIISKQSLLSLLPFIHDVQEELEHIEKEKEENMKNFDIDNIGMNSKALKNEKQKEENGKEIKEKKEELNEQP
jgi:SPP1 family phage portal protein